MNAEMPSSERDAIGMGVPAYDSGLAGRQPEISRLWQAFNEAAAGHLQVSLVTGEPGIGKTRLLNALADRARRQGATVLRGGSSEAEGMPPYLPFLEALGSHIRSTPPEQLRTQIGPAAVPLATIFPELPLRVEALPRSYPLPPE